MMARIRGCGKRSTGRARLGGIANWDHDRGEAGPGFATLNPGYSLMTIGFSHSTHACLGI